MTKPFTVKGFNRLSLLLRFVKCIKTNNRFYLFHPIDGCNWKGIFTKYGGLQDGMNLKKRHFPNEKKQKN